MTAESLDDLVARLRKRHSLSHDGGGFVDVYDDDDLAAADAIQALRARAETAEKFIRVDLTKPADYQRLEAEVVALREDAERYRWLMDVWDEACPFANGLPLWDYDSSMVNAAIDHERLAEDKGG